MTYRGLDCRTSQNRRHSIVGFWHNISIVDLSDSVTDLDPGLSIRGSEEAILREEKRSLGGLEEMTVI